MIMFKSINYLARKLQKKINLIFLNLILRCINIFFNIYNSSFLIKKVISINKDNKKNNIYYKYLLSKIIKLNKGYDLLDIEILNEINRKIILENKNLNNLDKILSDKNINDNNEIIIHKKDKIYLNILLINDKLKEEISIIDIIKIYYDKSKYFDNNLKNILRVNNIEERNYNKLKVEYYERFLRKSDIYNLNEIISDHISDII